MNKRQKNKNTKKALQNYLNGIASNQDMHVLQTYGKTIINAKYSLDIKSVLFIYKNMDLISEYTRNVMVRLEKSLKELLRSITPAIERAVKFINETLQTEEVRE